MHKQTFGHRAFHNDKCFAFLSFIFFFFFHFNSFQFSWKYFHLFAIFIWKLNSEHTWTMFENCFFLFHVLLPLDVNVNTFSKMSCRATHKCNSNCRLGLEIRGPRFIGHWTENILAYKIENHQQNQVFIQRGHQQAPFKHFSDGVWEHGIIQQDVKCIFGSVFKTSFFACIHTFNIQAFSFEFVSSQLSWLSKPYWLLYLKCISVENVCFSFFFFLVLSIVHNTFDSVIRCVKWLLDAQLFFSPLFQFYVTLCLLFGCINLFRHFSRIEISFIFFSRFKLNCWQNVRCSPCSLGIHTCSSQA